MSDFFLRLRAILKHSNTLKTTDKRISVIVILCLFAPSILSTRYKSASNGEKYRFNCTSNKWNVDRWRQASCEWVHETQPQYWTKETLKITQWILFVWHFTLSVRRSSDELTLSMERRRVATASIFLINVCLRLLRMRYVCAMRNWRIFDRRSKSSVAQFHHRK